MTTGDAASSAVINRRSASRRSAVWPAPWWLGLVLLGVAPLAVLLGRAVALPIVVVGVLSAVAAALDVSERRIPNRLVLVGAGMVALGVVLVAVVDQRALSEALGGAGAGWLLGGAPLLLALWLVRPASVGGGDIKLLSVQSAAVGLLAPYAAPLILLVGYVIAVGQSVVLGRRRELPLAPGLFVGYLVAVAAAIAAPQVFGGMYT